MRYLIQFVDKTTKRISGADAKAVMAALSAGKPVILRGAFMSPHYISCIKPISKDWFDAQTAEENRELESAKPMKYIEESNAKFLGFQDKKVLLEAPSWTKAGLIAQLAKK